MRAVPALALAVTLGALARPAPARPRPPTPAAGAPKAATSGTIRGTVRFEGTPPPRPALRRDSDPYCAKLERTAEDVVVTNGGLKDVLVRIKPGTIAAAPLPADAPPVVIDQRECMYAPRVVAVRPGQALAVRNSDGTFHNVHGTVGAKHLWNKPHPPQGADLALPASAQPGEVIDVVCDVHPWMHAYAVVTDHPHVAVTGEDGAFTLTGLAAGTYTLEAWHPTLGARSLTVKVGTGKKASVTARLTYKREDMQE